MIYRKIAYRCGPWVSIAALLIGANVTDAVAEVLGDWSGNGTAADSSPFNNAASFNGTYVAGPKPGTLAFEVGPASQVIIPRIPAYGLTQYADGFSLSFQVNHLGNSWSANDSTVVSLGDDGSGEYNKLFFDAGYAGSGRLDFHVNYPGSSPLHQYRNFILSNPVALPTDQWISMEYVVQDIDPGVYYNPAAPHTYDVQFFLDGRQVGSYDVMMVLPSPGAPFDIGFSEPCCTFSGAVADIELSALGVPEPATLGILGVSILGLGLVRCRAS